jgi:hypothetical protein
VETQRWRLTLGLTIALCAAPAAHAEVVRVEIITREPVLDGAAFGAVGPYERVVGRVHFAVDPRLPANRAIADIDLAPRNAEGRVEFSSDLYMLRPVDQARGNGTVLFEVGNRGRKGLLDTFSMARTSLDPRTAEDFGDRFLMERGYTLAWIGWQADVHDHLETVYTSVEAGTPPNPHLLRFRAPVATQDGKPIRGWVRSDFVPNVKSLSFHLADRTHRPYEVADLDDHGIRLTVRARRNDPREVIPRDRWQFAREVDGKPAPSRAHVFMPSGFEAGMIYEIVYPAEHPVVVGLGLAAVRDFMSFLKHGSAGLQGSAVGADWPRHARTIGFGSSQSGRFLRTFLYFGFNADEEGRPAFDGIWSHVGGGGRGSFNHRFAQPSRDARPFFNFFYPTDLFPFSDAEQTDPDTGRTEGLLTRTTRAGVLPRIFQTNSSYEYYGRAASLIHTTLDGARDVAPDPNTRIYLLAGTQHGPGRFPPTRGSTQNLANPNDFRWAMRALLDGLHQWIEKGAEPPASQYPTIAAGQLVHLADLQFPTIPGVAKPERMHHADRLDFGPEFLTRGIVAFEPPRLGTPFVNRVPQVSADDGNETAGIRLPVIQVPLASYTGWNLRHPDIGAPDELLSMVGSYLPFARTRAERLTSGDPRLSIEERYPDRRTYMDRIADACAQLVAGRYMLAQDVEAASAQAAAQWEYYQRR